MKTYNDLIRKIFWSLMLLFVFQIGKNIYIPGFSAADNQEAARNAIERFLSTTTGGRFSIPTLFSLGMSPYMTGLIIWSTVSLLDIDRINNMSNKQRSFFQKLVTLLFAMLQAITMMFGFKTKMHYELFPGLSQAMVLMIGVGLLTTGAMFVCWLADMNCDKGIGAQSLFIIPSLIMNAPSMLISGRSRDFDVNAPMIIGLIILTIVFVYITLYLYKSEYRIHVQRTSIDSKFNNSYIPIRLLTAGAMPYMFAITVFSLPQLLLMIPAVKNTAFAHFLAVFFSFNNVQGVLMYGLIVFLLGLGFSFINVRPHDVAKSLKNSGDYIFGVVPGEKTEEYVREKLLVISAVGNLYLVAVVWIPLFIGLKVDLVSNLAFYFGSLFMLIIILDNLIQEVKFVYFKGMYQIF